MVSSLRNAVWQRAKNRCEVCAKPVSRANWEAHVHHKVYRGHGAERLADLELRCLECHQWLHPGRALLDKQQQDARRARVPLRAVVFAEEQGLTKAERRSLTGGAGRWAWRPEPEEGSAVQ